MPILGPDPASALAATRRFCIMTHAEDAPPTRPNVRKLRPSQKRFFKLLDDAMAGRDEPLPTLTSKYEPISGVEKDFDKDEGPVHRCCSRGGRYR
jgi:hypothetical protein